MSVQANERLISIKQVESMIGFKKDFIYRRIKEGDFPKQINFGKRSARWRVSEIQNWIERQAQ